MPTTAYELELFNVAPRIGGYKLVAPYIAGQGVIYLNSLVGLPNPPFRLTVVTLASRGTGLLEVLTVYPVTSVNTGNNSVIIGSPIENTSDRNYSIGDIAEIRDDASAITDLNAAVIAVTPTVITGVVAAGTNQSTATHLVGNCSIQQVSSVPTGTGVILPIPVLPASVTVINAGANSLLVYPQVGATINGGSGPFTVSPGDTVPFLALAPTGWVASSVLGGSIPPTGNIITQYTGAVVVPLGTSGTIILDLSLSNRFAPAALTGATTFVFSNPPSSGFSQAFFVEVIPGGNSITWPGTVKWGASLNNVAPTPTSTPGKIDVFTFVGNSSSWLGGVYDQGF